ncbi:MAG: sulfatase-like hydrolase/transferase [Candidatus Hydrogenedentes bacterium]|nr:sulfatase-like hydrolase/transferase [Candidatus Hydrogenedentota bacterium]
MKLSSQYFRSASRRDFLRASAAASAGLAAAALPVGAEERSGLPNVLFILADDLGWGDLACYGHPHILTPNLDALARQGTQFLQFYANSPVCSPSRAAILTGQFPARNRIHTQFSGAEAAGNPAMGMPDYLDPAAPTVSRLLQQAGYSTGFVGKWHLSGSPEAPPITDYGFDCAVPLSDYDASEPFFEARVPGRLVDDAMAFLDQHQEGPFFLCVWPPSPHALIDPTDEQLFPYRYLEPGRVPYRGAMQLYYAAVTELDRQVGRLLEHLENLGLAESTLVLFVSDNGPEDVTVAAASHSAAGSTGPFRGRKRSLYEGGIRVPFIARWPRFVPAGRVDATSVLSGVDLLPTLCRLAKVVLPEDQSVDGEVIVGNLYGRERPREKGLYWDYRFENQGQVADRSPRLALREEGWKLLMNPDRSRVELYDIPNDPGELTNLADCHPDIADEMFLKLFDWSASLCMNLGRLWVRSIFLALQQSKVFVPLNACCFQVITNYEYRHFVVGRDYNRPGKPGFCISAVAALLSLKDPALGEKNMLQIAPVNRCQPRHSLCARRQSVPLHTYPSRGNPFPPFAGITRFLKDLLNCSHICCRG